MTEAEFQSVVMGVARMYKWVVYHVYDSRRTSAKGCPDLIMLHEGQRRLVFAELKTQRGKLTPEQEWWIRVLSTCGIEAVVWRPSDLPDIPKFLSPT